MELMSKLFLSLLALSYNIALCHYSLKMYPQALKHVEDIKNRGIKEHPGMICGGCLLCVIWLSPMSLSYMLELSVGMTSEGVDFHSVGNTLELQQTALIEALNLKAAIEYQLKNGENVSWCLRAPSNT